MDIETLKRLAHNPRRDAAIARQVKLIRAGGDKPSTTAQRLDALEHALDILSLTEAFRNALQSVERSARDIILDEKIADVLALEGEAFEKAALALSDSEAKLLADRLGTEHFARLENAEIREWLLSLIDRGRAAEIVFELLPIEQLEHRRVTRLVRGRRPEVTTVPAAEAPTPNGTTILVEPLPDAVSRAHSLAAWKASGEPLPEL